MARDDAIRDMRIFAARGRLGDRYAQPALRLQCPARTVRGEVINITWHAVRCRDAVLTIESPGRLPINRPVAAQGRIPLSGLQVGRHLITLRARPAGARRQFEMERQAVLNVVHPAPTIAIHTPRRTVFGETIRVSWQIQDADRAELAFNGGNARQIAVAEVLELRPDVCGPLRLLWRANGPGGDASKTATILVNAQPVVIRTPGIVTATYGDDVTVRYAISGAARATLATLDRAGAPRPIPLSGRVEIAAAMESERLVITAVGQDGRTHTKSIAVQIGPEPAPSIDDFLEILNGGPNG